MPLLNNGMVDEGSMMQLLSQLQGQNQLTQPPLQAMPQAGPSAFGAAQPDMAQQMQEMQALNPQVSQIAATSPEPMDLGLGSTMPQNFGGMGMGALAPTRVSPGMGMGALSLKRVGPGMGRMARMSGNNAIANALRSYFNNVPGMI